VRGAARKTAGRQALGAATCQQRDDALKANGPPPMGDLTNALNLETAVDRLFILIKPHEH
jgi:hypothetical protein